MDVERRKLKQHHQRTEVEICHTGTLALGHLVDPNIHIFINIYLFPKTTILSSGILNLNLKVQWIQLISPYFYNIDIIYFRTFFIVHVTINSRRRMRSKNLEMVSSPITMACTKCTSGSCVYNPYPLTSVTAITSALQKSSFISLIFNLLNSPTSQ